MRPPTRNEVGSVEAYLRDSIRQGVRVAGQRVTESEIIRETGAARTRVRQAFQRLATEGIMIIEEFRGASVKRLSQSEILHLYQIREVLEGLAARLAAISATGKTKDQLMRLQAQMNAAENAVDFTAFAQLNNQWHQEIIDASGNTYVQATMSRLNVPLSRMLNQFFLKPAEISAANDYHRVITQAIVDGAPEAAERAMRRHIRVPLKALAVEGKRARRAPNF